MYYNPLRVMCADPGKLTRVSMVWCFLTFGVAASGATRQLTTGAEVHTLKPEEAAAGLPVRIHGVVTSTDRNGGMVQDTTRGVYVCGLRAMPGSADLRAGDCVEVEGMTARGTFAPMINCSAVRRVGHESLPKPIRPTWEQLNNGSMDCQYIELEGVVTEAYPQTLVLLLPEGHLGIAIVPDSEADMKRLNLRRYANKQVRLRGTVFATRDNETHRVRAGSIGLGNPFIAAANPVLTIDKDIGRLLQFDARAANFHRVKVAGQILYAREREYYLSDGTNALRFVTRKPVQLTPGDHVEVTGFPRLAGSLPVLLEASPHRIAQSGLPAGHVLAGNNLSERRNIGMRIELQARFAGIRTNRTDIMLDLQAGASSVVARLMRKSGEFPPLAIGSVLRVTGVYAGQGRERDSAELLLNSPADVQIVEQPSWWTPGRALSIVSSLIGALLLGAVWVVSLRGQVEARTAELKAEIEQRKRAQAEVEHVHKKLVEQILAREHAERQHLLEAERSRLAGDLHDELGSSLTEISLLANGGAGVPPTLEKASDRFRQIADKAGGVIDALDVIVWAVNPATDSLQPMADYVSSFAREFLSACGLKCRLKVPIEFPAVALDSQSRHNLFLAVKESLNNAARHSDAAEVEFSMAIVDQCLQITVTDNGVGFDISSPTSGLGLANLRRRLEAIGGQCSVDSRAGTGTSVTMFLPLPSDTTAVKGEEISL